MPTAFVLAGGGSLGAVEAGMLRARFVAAPYQRYVEHELLVLMRLSWSVPPFPTTSSHFVGIARHPLTPARPLDWKCKEICPAHRGGTSFFSSY